jgi:hypothetical protein
MKQNKEIKVGDRIWLNCPCLNQDSYYTVKSVKKEKTCVSVVVTYKDYKGKEREINMYGHSSSCILSGYDRGYRNYEISYTCEYEIIKSQTVKYDSNQKYIDAGRALLNVAKYF